jgi:hypothetical protein
MPPHHCFCFQFCSLRIVWGSLCRQISTYWTLLYRISKCVYRLMPACLLCLQNYTDLLPKQIKWEKFGNLLLFKWDSPPKVCISVTFWQIFTQKEDSPTPCFEHAHPWTFWTVCKSHSNFMKWECISAIKPISCKTRQAEICTIQPYLCLSIDYTLSGIITLCCCHLWTLHHLHCILLH